MGSDDTTYHIIPINDLREHVANATCWCSPDQDEEEPSLMIHHSLDGREAYETGERNLN